MITIPTFIFVVLFISAAVTALLSVTMWSVEERKNQQLQIKYEKIRQRCGILENENQKLKMESFIKGE